MNRLFLSAILILGFADAFAARSQEPVVITTCRAFGARSDEQSKIALKNRFKSADEQCATGDCDDINKVCSNAILSIDKTMQGEDGEILLRAFYPDGKSYNYYILLNFRENDPDAVVEYWASSSADFKKSTYAIAISDEDKIGYDVIFRSGEVAPQVVPAIIYSLANDMSLTDTPQLARRQYDLALISILEAMVGGVKGYTKDFVKSDEWFDISKRNLALKTLRDYILDNPHLLNLNSSLDNDGKDFANYMQKFSDEYAVRVKEQFALESRDFDPSKTPILDSEAFAKAKAFTGIKQVAKKSKFGNLRLKKIRTRRR